MADIESNVKINIDTSDALAQLKLLQNQISAFQQAMRKAGAANAASAAAMQQNLVNSINATGKFQANIQTIQTSAERFTTALEKNKLTMGEYFRYAGGASKTFGKLFKSEFDTINQVARERVKDLQTQYIKLGRDANGAMKAISVRPLALDMENLGTKTQIAAQRQQLFNQLMKQGSTQLLNFGKNTQWAGRQLMVGFTVPLTMMGTAAAQAYMQIEKASVSFKRVYGDMNTTTEETNKMVKSVQALANEFTKYGLAVSDTMDMASKAAAMGKTGNDLLQQVSEATKLAVLGGVDQNKALETTISLTNAFGISTQDLGKNVDFLNAVENQTVLSIEDMTTAIPKAAPVVKQLGGNVKDLAFFLTAMKEGGINASEGANAIKSGLASMINPTAKASSFLQGFGINIKGIVESDKGNLRKTVIDFAKALDTLDPLNRARAIEQMFGKFQFSRMSTLFQNVIAQGSQAQQVARLGNQTAEELAVLSEREMKKVSDSPMYKFQKSIEDMKAKLAPVGEAFLKAVTPIVQFVSKILDGFNNLSDGAKQFIGILTIAVAGIGPALLMGFGLIANGIANIMKLFTNMKGFINKTTKPSDILGQQTGYMNSEQLKGAAIAASLDQAHAKLRQTFTSEVAAVNALTEAYRNAVAAQGAFAGVPGVPVGNPNAKPKSPKKYATGTRMVPGPTGAGDIVPALLSPGEAVIPAKQAQQYAPIIHGMIAGNLPGFMDGTPGAGMRQSIIGPLTQKQHEGMARTALQLEEISKEVMAGPYGKVAPTNYGTQISPTTGHSFPAFGVGGIYEKPDGSKVFVKPQMDLTSAMAEMRGTAIARDAHGLQAPTQKIGVMMDPTDPDNRRRFIVLESPVDPKFANAPTSFNQQQYFKQHVAALLRGDKDLGLGNLGGNILADVGPAGVFQRASGKRQLGGKINSMEEQAIINLLGVKGGAKRFFAESTAEIAKNMTPAEYDAAMKAEIQSVIPKLKSTIAGFGPMSPEEKAAYANMQQRLEAGLGVDWGKYQVMHSAVPPKKYAHGGIVAGYNEGTDNVTGWDKEQLTHLQKAWVKDNLYKILTTGKVPKVQQALVESGLTRLNPTVQKMLEVEILGSLVSYSKGSLNQFLREKSTNSAVSAQEFLSHWNANPDQLLSTVAHNGVEINDPGMITAARAMNNEIGKTAVSLSAGKPIKDSQLSLATEQVISKYISGADAHAKVAKALQGQSEVFGEIRIKPDKNAQIGGLDLGTYVTQKLASGELSFGEGRPGEGIAQTLFEGNGKPWSITGKGSRGLGLFRLGGLNTATRKALFKKYGSAEGIVQAFAEGRERLTSSFQNATLRGDKGYSTGKQKNIAETIKEANRIAMESIPDGAVEDQVAIMASMLPSVGGKFKIKKYADGVFSVPGPKGAGDVVPAMLSPGEAVIPADTASQHRGLISQMISGNIPGYADGLDPYGGGGFGSYGFGNPLPVIIMQDRTKDGTTNDGKNSGDSNPEEDTTEETKKRTMGDRLRTAFTRTPMTGKVQTGLYGASAVAGIAASMPGITGQIGQAILGPIGAATTAMMMIPGPAGMVAAGLAALVTGAMMLNDHFQKVRDESVRMTKEMGAGNDAMQKFADFAKTVSGTEAMDKRRANSASGYFNVVEGKTTFGESYMKSDAGKALVKSVDNEIKNGGGMESAKKLITNQLSTAIAAGIMTPEQARSIANNLGAQLGDMNFGIQIAGTLTDLMGPNGENLKNDPLQVRLQVVKSSMDQFNKSVESASQINAISNTQAAGTTGLMGLGGAIGGGAAGLGIGSILTGLGVGAAAGAEGGVAAGPIGLAVGAIGGAIAGLTVGIMNYQDQVAKLGGAMSESMLNTLQVQQQMVDSLQVDYEKRIASAKAAGDTAEATRLQNQYLIDQKALLETNATNVKAMYADIASQDNGFFGLFNTGMQNTLSDTANKAIETAYAGSGQELTAKMVQSNIDNAGGQKSQQIALKQMVAAKQIGLSQAQTATSIFGGSQSGMDQLQALLQNSPVEANRALGIASNLGTKEAKKFLVDISVKDPQSEQQVLDALETVQKATGPFGSQPKTAKAMIEFAVKNPSQFQKMKKQIDILANNGKPLTVAIIQKSLGKDVAKAINDDYTRFQKYSKQNQIVYTTELATIMKMQGDKNMIASWHAYQKEFGIDKTFAQFASYQADRTVTTQGTDTTAKSSSGSSGGGGSKSSSWLDPYVNVIRDLYKDQQKLTTGFKDSGKALSGFVDTSKKKYGGLIYDLKKAGASNEIIKAALGGDEATTNALIDKKTGQLKKGAAKILKGVQESIAAAKIADYFTMSDSERNQTKIDSAQAGLDVIAGKEKDINKLYDDRQSALDEISKLNDRNNQHQQDALTLADALSKGDIAAAARAAQQTRADDQASALADAKDSLENERKKELEAITVKMGDATYTRLQLEQKISDLTAANAQSKADELATQLKINEAALDNFRDQLKTGGANNNNTGGGSTGTGGGSGGGGGGGGGAAHKENDPVTGKPGFFWHKDGSTWIEVKQDMDAGSGKIWDHNSGSWKKITKPVVSYFDANKKILSSDIASNAKAMVGTTAAQKQATADMFTHKDLADKARTTATSYMQTYSKLKNFMVGGKKVDMTSSTDTSKMTAGEKSRYDDLKSQLSSTTNKLQDFNLAVDNGKIRQTVHDEFSNSDIPQVLSNIDQLSKIGTDTIFSPSSISKQLWADYKAGKLPPGVKWLKNRISLFNADKKIFDPLREKIDSAKNKAGLVGYNLSQIMGDPDSENKFITTIKSMYPAVDPYQTVSDYIAQNNTMIQNAKNANAYRRDLFKLYPANYWQPLFAGDGDWQNFQNEDGSGKFNVTTAQKISKYATGGMVVPKGYATGGGIYGTDTVPAMLTPGEFVVKKSAVDNIGVETLNKINNSSSQAVSGDNVYNINVSVSSNASPDQIAQAVMQKIQSIDNQRIRGSRF